jgi:arylsulfatase A-like enzyme
VLVFAPCTVNKFQLAPYAKGVTTTPNLEAFAKDSVVFERHQTEAGYSGIAYASIYTGADASVHGIYAHPDVIEDRVDMSAEAFAAAGYETYLFDAHLMANRELGYAQGVPEENRFAEIPSADSAGWRRILRGLREHPDRRAYVMTAFSVTHKPYSQFARLREFCRDHGDPVCPPPGSQLLYYDEFNQKVGWNRLTFDFPESAVEAGYGPREIARYVAEKDLLYRASIFRLDEIFGGILESIDRAGLRDQSVVVFTADHGEVLDRKNALFHWHHGASLAPEVLSVAWLLRAPGIAPGRYPQVTRSMDVLPTVAGLSGVKLAEGPGHGVDLAPVLRGRAPAPELTARSFTSYLRSRVHEGMDPRYLQFYPSPELRWTWVSERRGDEIIEWRNRGDGEFVFQRFDLASDPNEAFDLARTPPDAADRADRAELEAYKQSLIDGEQAKLARTSDTALPIQEIERRLRSLGYVR